MFRTAVFVLFCSFTLVLSQNELSADSTLDDFFDYETDKVINFFRDQANRVKQVVKSTYVGLDSGTIRNSVDVYLEHQRKLLAVDVNRYVESLKASGKKVADLWESFLPTEDPASRLENPDLVLSVPAVITRNGYDCETHTIVSQGYILNIHRIPRPKSGKEISKDTVILHSGLFDSSFGWIINGPEKSLAFALADAGYDVWLTNDRGNIYSREHAWYKTDTKEFWNFSFHETAQYDVPALIDYIKKVKGDTKMAFIGHSQGTTILFSMLSLRPEYNRELQVGIALAPAVFFSNMNSPLKLTKNFVGDIVRSAMAFHSYEIAQRDFLDKLANRCKEDYSSITCKNVIFYLVGEDEEQMNQTIISHFLLKESSASWKNILHLIQMINSGKFQQFDYGHPEYNKAVYGSNTPPEYKLANVDLNITLFWAQNDLLSNEKDVLLLHEKVRSTKTYLVPFPKFNHVDYLWAKDAPKLVNDKVLEILKEAMRSYH